jgi:calcium-binding protein CML
VFSPTSQPISQIPCCQQSRVNTLSLSKFGIQFTKCRIESRFPNIIRIPIPIPILFLFLFLLTSSNFNKSPYFENRNNFFFFSSRIMGFKSLFHRKKKSDSANNSSTTTATTTTNSFPSRSTSLNKTAEQMAELEQVFKKFDVNGDGKISSSELGSIMGSLGHPATEEELEKMIREVDADGDGYIDLKEFVELNTKGVDSDEALENLKDAFSVYDIDGNGVISAEELLKVMRSLGDECSLAECKKMISGVDRNGDGMISFDEFKVMMMMGSRQDLMDPPRQVSV